MSATRIFSDTTVPANSELELTGNAARHVAKALRMKAGDTLRLFDGSGNEYPARITNISKSAVRVATGDGVEIKTESSLAIELWQGVSKGGRMDNVVQKATELGVARIRPVLTEYSVIKLDDQRGAKKLAHWREVAISACEQSGRVRVPEILPPERFTAALATLSPEAEAMMLVPGNHKPLSIGNNANRIVVMIGPEGGFSPDEERLASEHGVRLASMGTRVLRTETAPVAALSILQYQAGDMG